jgi:hypothetical protein
VFRRCAAATIGQAALRKKPRAGALRSHFVTTAKQRRYASQREGKSRREPLALLLSGAARGRMMRR